MKSILKLSTALAVIMSVSGPAYATINVTSNYTWDDADDVRDNLEDIFNSLNTLTTNDNSWSTYQDDGETGHELHELTNLVNLGVTHAVLTVNTDNTLQLDVKGGTTLAAITTQSDSFVDALNNDLLGDDTTGTADSTIDNTEPGQSIVTGTGTHDGTTDGNQHTVTNEGGLVGDAIAGLVTQLDTANDAAINENWDKATFEYELGISEDNPYTVDNADADNKVTHNLQQHLDVFNQLLDKEEGAVTNLNANLATGTQAIAKFGTSSQINPTTQPTDVAFYSTWADWAVNKQKIKVGTSVFDVLDNGKVAYIGGKWYYSTTGTPTASDTEITETLADVANILDGPN